jgi:segregation and condensation protein B
MEIGNIIPHIEALIFASDKPLTSMEITELINNAFGFMEEKLTLEQIQTSIDGIIEKYGSEFYPFEVRESGGGWQFLTKKDYHKTVAQLNGEKFLKRLSSAALETLAIIAYKQPITKGEIEAIRGVSSDYSIQKLLEKELIIISGRNEDMPGKPLVYQTSKTFMDYFGINSAADLPKLKEIFADTIVDPTIITHNPGEMASLQPETPTHREAPEGEISPLVVSEEGELIIAAEESAASDDAAEESAAEPGATSNNTESAVPTEQSEESDETPDTDADAVEDALNTGADLTGNSDAEPSSESDEEGDDEALSGDDGTAGEEDQDDGEEDDSDDTGEQPPHNPGPDISDVH